TYPLQPAGFSCNDSNACTGNDVCDSTGTCAGAPVACEAPPGQCYQSAGSCSDGSCSYAYKAAGAACDDGDACTLSETCNGSGGCAGTPVSCTTPPGQCYQAAGTCSNGTCEYALKAAGTACDDGNASTLGDVCSSTGTCAGTACNTPPNTQCYNPTGTESNGTCSYTPKAAGTACNDGNATTRADVCNSSGTCAGTACNTPPDAQCYNPIGTDSNGTCVYTPKANGTACNDSNTCTQSDTCQSGTCSGSSPILCTASDQCHAAGTCNPLNGTCSNPLKAAGSACND
ncbi:hypothetical protein HMI50_44070, partial [Corallococcus carmarthensis]|nr:hypothetical protein [Corallococcus carmarthensis]